MMISFIVIAYNEERNIVATLQAIVAQQNVPLHEIIVVNDGSSDGTLGVVRQIATAHPNIRVVDLRSNRGRGAARAAGVAAAKGDYLAFVDADIILPSDWLQRCLAHAHEYDACGGIAVPDGDVAWIHRIFGLSPKVAPHTTTVTGSNGLFRRSVFDYVSFDPDKKNGEDVALGYQIAAAKLRTFTVPELLVEHRETKTYGESLRWLFVSGIGASRQLYEHRQLRLPDMAFFGCLLLGLVACLVLALGVLAWYVPLGVVLAYVLLSSALHLHSKFVLIKTPFRSMAAVVANSSLLFAYYCGRTSGLITQWRRPWPVSYPS